MLNSTNAVLELCSVATELLTKCKRGSIHEVRTTDLHDISHCLCLRIESLMKLTKPWESNFDDLLIASDVHACGEGIVRGLRLIDVVIRKESLFAFADDLTCELVCTVGDHLIDVHVALRTRSGLPDY